MLKDEPLNQLERLCDESLFYNVNVEELQDRLILRKMKGHLSKEEAIDFYNASDKKNVETVIIRSKKADIVLNIAKNRVYCHYLVFFDTNWHEFCYIGSERRS